MHEDKFKVQLIDGEYYMVIGSQKFLMDYSDVVNLAERLTNVQHELLRDAIRNVCAPEDSIDDEDLFWDEI